MVATWRCLSGVVEEGVRHMERPGGLLRSGEDTATGHILSRYHQLFCFLYPV